MSCRTRFVCLPLNLAIQLILMLVWCGSVRLCLFSISLLRSSLFFFCITNPYFVISPSSLPQSCVRSFDDEGEDVEAEAGVKAPATGADISTCAAGEDAVAPAPTAVFKRPKMIKNPNAGARALALPFSQPCPACPTKIICAHAACRHVVSSGQGA